MTTIGELLGGFVDQIPDEEDSVRIQEHRVKSVKRPDSEVTLNAVYSGDFEPKKTQLDPTDDLVEIFLMKDGAKCINESDSFAPGYIVYCKETQQVWYAHDDNCLNANFIYREDLEIIQVKNSEETNSALADIYEEMPTWYETRKVCYILDNPPDESYEVYYDSNYPKQVYGKATPDGMFVHRYKNRFHRDMFILSLDKAYTVASKRATKKLQKKKFDVNDAIVISDGCWMANSCSSSFVYIDNKSLLHMTEGYLPEEEDQAVLISEVAAAINAIKMCVMRKKKNITYYYDNTSILNVFKNRKTEYISEVAEWKRLLEDIHSKGYKVNFIELHPKNSESSIEENKALMFFHNMCDSNCRHMSKLFQRSYVDYVIGDDTSGKVVRTYNDVKQQSKKTSSNRYRK